MSYTITQQLNQYPTDPRGWDDDITANSGANYFIAVTANKIEKGAAQRTMTVQIFPLEGAPINNTTNSGLYLRQEGEKSVKAILLDTDGKEVASNVADYPS